MPENMFCNIDVNYINNVTLNRIKNQFSPKTPVNQTNLLTHENQSFLC